MILVLLDRSHRPTVPHAVFKTPVTISAQPRNCNGRCSSWCQRRWSKSGSAAGINFKAGHFTSKGQNWSNTCGFSISQYLVVPGYDNDCGIWLWDMTVLYYGSTLWSIACQPNGYISRLSTMAWLEKWSWRDPAWNANKWCDVKELNIYIYSLVSLWLFNIAMENGPFIDGLPIKNGDFPWLC